MATVPIIPNAIGNSPHSPKRFNVNILLDSLLSICISGDFLSGLAKRDNTNLVLAEYYKQIFQCY